MPLVDWGVHDFPCHRMLPLALDQQRVPLQQDEQGDSNSSLSQVPEPQVGLTNDSTGDDPGAAINDTISYSLAGLHQRV